MVKLITFAVCFFIFLIFGIVIAQDFLIFPGLLNYSDVSKPLPQGVSRFFVETLDRKKLDLWHLEASISSQGAGSITDNKKKVALIFHGNGWDNYAHYFFQEAFSSEGYDTWMFDYRGYGRSSGWPSEIAILADAHTISEYVSKKTGVPLADFTIVGVSVGTGPASYIASKIKPKSLLLVSPYTSIPDIVSRSPIFRYLVGFLFYNFPVYDNVSKLKNTCLVVVHGTKDRVIPFELGKRVFENYQGEATNVFIKEDNSSHNDVFLNAREEIFKALKSCD